MNLKHKYLSLLSIICISIFSCRLEKPKQLSQIDYYSNGKIKQKKVRVDSTTDRYELYFENGVIKSEYFKKNNLVSGYSKTYFSNGRLESEGEWHKGKRIGILKIYDSTGYLSKLIEYISFKDSSVSKPNQIFTFAPNGDTLLNGKSFFYEYWYIKDTINHGQDDYTFKILLRGHIFKNALVRICDYDENFNLRPRGKCDELEMKDYVIQASMDRRRYRNGENILRGAIINFDSTNSATIYFEKRFYVR